jgi:hypothetical protein
MSGREHFCNIAIVKTTQTNAKYIKSSKNKTNNRHQGNSKLGHHDTSCTVAVIGITTFKSTRFQTQSCGYNVTRFFIIGAKKTDGTSFFNDVCAILIGTRECVTIIESEWTGECAASTFLLFFWLCCPVVTNIAFQSTP